MTMQKKGHQRGHEQGHGGQLQWRNFPSHEPKQGKDTPHQDRDASQKIANYSMVFNPEKTAAVCPVHTCSPYRLFVYI
jgi:hypothetical protein